MKENGVSEVVIGFCDIWVSVHTQEWGFKSFSTSLYCKCLHIHKNSTQLNSKPSQGYHSKSRILRFRNLTLRLL